MISVEVWIIPSSKEILVTDYPGPPASICGYVSEEARQAAQEWGYATVSEIGFPSECYLGSFEGEKAWEEALAVSRPKAEELGYQVRVVDSLYAAEEWEDEEEDVEYEEWDLWEEDDG